MWDIESGDFTSCVRNVRRVCVAVRVLRYVPKHSPATASARVNAPSRPLDREDICPYMLFKNMNLDKRIVIYPINQDLIWMVTPTSLMIYHDFRLLQETWRSIDFAFCKFFSSAARSTGRSVLQSGAPHPLDNYSVKQPTGLETFSAILRLGQASAR